MNEIIKQQLYILVFTMGTQIVSIYISYLLGKRQAKIKYYDEVKEKRYLALYVPYIRSLYMGSAAVTSMEFCTFETSQIFLEILEENIHFMGKKSLSDYQNFYRAHLDLLEHEDGNQDFISAPVIYQKIFIRITISILEEALELSTKLKMPPIAQPLLSKFYAQK